MTPLGETIESDQIQDVYHIILFQFGEMVIELPTSLKSDEQENYLPFNLIQNPQDICITISGGNMVTNHVSNEIRISKEELQELLSRK